mmetsp:Transcript_12824/g.30296  ORF Transcript_12824/g.30296 Transcript_12824/m.30296 type:complete len:422 (-) Transcript_12824:326-1591(-)
MLSSTGPRSSCSRCISSMITSRTSWVYARPSPWRVTMSHFSGVVTIICVSLICCRVRLESPLSSRTVTPYGPRRFEKFLTTSWTSAFIGATYMILKDERSNFPSWGFLVPASPSPSSTSMAVPPASASSLRYWPRTLRMLSMATFVFPAPVGAHRSRFSFVWRATLAILLWTRLSVFMPLNASCVHAGSSETGTSFSPAGATFRAGGTWTSSYPGCMARQLSSGSVHDLFVMVWLPSRNSRLGRSSSWGCAEEDGSAASASPLVPRSARSSAEDSLERFWLSSSSSSSSSSTSPSRLLRSVSRADSCSPFQSSALLVELSSSSTDRPSPDSSSASDLSTPSRVASSDARLRLTQPQIRTRFASRSLMKSNRSKPRRTSSWFSHSRSVVDGEVATDSAPRTSSASLAHSSASSTDGARRRWR